jgi:signal transduction histidine kinase
VVITLSAEPATATITVQDNGIGIDNAYGKKVFEPFFRVPTGSVHNVAGHGLGLSFASEIIKLHGGTISFHSNGNGTSFYLKFKTI